MKRKVNIGGVSENVRLLSSEIVDVNKFLVAPKQNCAPIACIRVFGIIMLGFVLGLFSLVIHGVWTPYKVYFLVSPFYTLCLLFFFLFAGLTVASYLQTMFTDPGGVPEDWHLKVSQSKELQKLYRRCHKTDIYRPPRSSYDQLTGRVILNFDHYCPWVNNSVGYFNRKFFILFTGYACLAAIIAALLLLPYGGPALGLYPDPAPILEPELQGPAALNEESGARFLRASHRRRKRKSRGLGADVESLMAFVFAFSFGITLAFFTAAHLWMAAKNTTSIQNKKDSSKYDLGWKKNLAQVFGSNVYYAFLPIYGYGPCGDGIHWLQNDGTWDGLEVEEWIDVLNSTS